MDNKKRNVHNSGPLGMLMNSGQIQEINNEIAIKQNSTPQHYNNNLWNKYALKDSGVEFTENELIYVNPKECEPWEFANRHESEMGDIDGLITSIKANKQLQPGLIRVHPSPHGNIKYEVIFGCRRHLACLNIDNPFLVILKKEMSLTEALACQHSENKCRSDISPFSDAIIYQKLLENRLVKNQNVLAKQLNMTKQNLSSIMSFTKLPSELINNIPNPHKISIRMAVAMATYIDKDKVNLQILLKNASELGVSINSEKSLELLFSSFIKKNKDNQTLNATFARTFSSCKGEKLFTFKTDKNGASTIHLSKQIMTNVTQDNICEVLSAYLNKEINSNIS